MQEGTLYLGRVQIHAEFLDVSQALEQAAYTICQHTTCPPIHAKLAEVKHSQTSWRAFLQMGYAVKCHFRNRKPHQIRKDVEDPFDQINVQAKQLDESNPSSR